MNFKYYSGYGYISTYTRTEITDDLHEVFGFRTDTVIVSEKNIKTSEKVEILLHFERH